MQHCRRHRGAAAGLPADPEAGRQFAAYLGTPTRARGYPPIEGDNALIVEVAPALAIERITDLALRSVPEIEPGILYVERQFGVLEVHHADQALVDRAGAAILEGIGATPADALRPHILYADVIEDITDQHAVIINRNREASMVLPGRDAAGVRDDAGAVRGRGRQRGRAGRARGDTGDVSMIGAAGRIYISGPTESVVRARDEITRELLESVEGREH